MQASELRIGNIVNARDLNNKWQLFKIEEYIDFAYAEKYEHVPLTEDWLLKFGFDLSVEDGLKIFRVNYLKLVTYADENVDYYWLGRYQGKAQYIKYVHQLQNLYFALTGKELELK